MSGNIIYDLYDSCRSLAAPPIKIGFPHIKKAYFANLVQRASLQTVPYTVVSGDTLGRIARAHDTTVAILKTTNQIKDVNKISVGQILIVPKEDVDKGNVTFDRIEGARMGQEIYIVVETENLSGRPLKINVRQGNEEVIGEVDKEIEIGYEDSHSVLIEVEVGAFADSGEFDNRDELLDLAVAKVKLEPSDKDSRDAWANAIADTDKEVAPLYLLVDAHSGNTDIDKKYFHYYGRNEGTDSKKNLWLDHESLYFGLTTGRAPWMDFVLEEARAAKGVKESEAPLKGRIKDEYHKYTSPNNSYGHTTAWCAAFSSWALNEAGYDNPQSGASKHFIDTDEETLKKIDKPIYGAIATWSDCDKHGNVKWTGHVSFVFGQYADSETTDKYLVLGGNQGDSLKVTKYDCTGNAFKSYKKTVKKMVVNEDGSETEVSSKVQVYKKFRGFYIPKDYEATAADELQETDTYISSVKANEAATTKAISSTAGESSR